VQAGWREAADQAGLKLTVDGILPLSHFGLPFENEQALATLFVQLMLDRGFLASPQLYASYAHEPRHVETYLDAVGEVFGTMALAVQRGDAERLLRGPVRHSGFQRLT
jgi:hypothetical protein